MLKSKKVRQFIRSSKDYSVILNVQLWLESFSVFILWQLSSYIQMNPLILQLFKHCPDIFWHILISLQVSLVNNETTNFGFNKCGNIRFSGEITNGLHLGQNQYLQKSWRTQRFNCASELMDHCSPSLTSKQANFKEKSSPKPICFATSIPPCDLKVICIRWLNRFSF